MIHYGMTKTAMLCVSRGLAELTRNTEVTVNPILCGPTYSEGVAGAVEQISEAQNQPVEQVKKHLIKALSPTSLIQRFIDTSEIANLVVNLSSPLSIATNGSAFRADGGVIAHELQVVAGQVVVAWLKAKKFFPILGARTELQIMDNLAAVQITFTTEQ